MVEETSAAATSLAATAPAAAPATPTMRRVIAVDVARGAALVAMIAFHFVWDLDFFGLVPSGTAASAWFKFLGHAIAACFLVIVGVSLALAARRGVDLGAFLRRIALVAAAAALITAATWIAFPREYIFFGILHCIAVASLAAAPFLRAPIKATFAVAVAALFLPFIAASDAFNAPAVQWIGLGTQEPITNDWAPFLPAFGFVLLGLAGARWALAEGLAATLASWTPKTAVPRLLARGGRRSLIVYLAHQPLLLAALFVATALAGRARPSEAASFISNCSAQCVARGAGRTYCDRACGCVATRSETTPLWSDVLDNRLSPGERNKFNAIARQCTHEIWPGR